MKNKTSLAILFFLSSQNVYALDTIMKDSVDQKSCNTQQSCQVRDKCIDLVKTFQSISPCRRFITSLINKSTNPYIQPEAK